MAYVRPLANRRVVIGTPPSGYAPGGVTYVPPVARGYPAPTGYAPGGVVYAPYPGGRAPTVPPPAANPAAKPAGALPQQPALTMEQQAAMIAAGLIDPQKNAIDRAVAAQQQALVGQQKAYEGVINAVGQLTSGIPGEIQSAYQQAGDRTAGYAGTLTGDLGAEAQQQAAEVSQRLAGFGLPGVQSVSPDAMNVLNYTGGVLPSQDLAAEAASRLTEASTLRGAGAVTLGQQALQALGASQKDIDELRQKGLDLELTRPAEAQKALQSLREEQRANAELAIKEQDFKLQQRAEGAQEASINRAWYQTLSAEAWNRTNATGRLWTVQGNKLVDTGRAAPGSAAGRAATSAAVTMAGQTEATNRAKIAARTQAARLTETQAHNKAMEGIARSQIVISKQNADTAAAREVAYAKAKAGQAGGMKQSDIRQYGKMAGSISDRLYNGVANPKYDPSKSAGPGNPQWSIPPQDAKTALAKMLAAKIPYSIAMNAIIQYAKINQPDGSSSRWWEALYWPGGPYYDATPTPDTGFRGAKLK